LKDIGGERWGPPLLEGPERALNDAREQLARLEHPSHAQSPDAARAALDRTTAAATVAHERVTHAQADIAQRVAEAKQKRQQLSQAYELADTLAKEHPEFGPEWEALRARIAQLESRWTQASSYSEALDALTQAVQRTEAFTASARAQA
jgi:predicted RNase H-like nuclease (RuvC/YqgF family)